MEEMLSTSLIEVMDFKANILIIDSLSALLQLIGLQKARSLIHNLLIRVTRAEGLTAVGIVEAPLGEERVGLGVEEFMADILLYLARRGGEERRVFRELEIIKARGVEVPYHSLLFTLHGGFKIIQPFTYEPSGITSRFKPVEDLDDAYSTGIQGLDALIGGYPKGGTAVIEYEGNLSPIMYTALILPIAANFVSKAKGALILPGPVCPASVILEKFRTMGGFTVEEIKSLSRIVSPYRTGLSLGDWLIEVPESFERFHEAWHDASSQLQTTTGKKDILMYIATDSIYYAFGDKALYEFLFCGKSKVKGEGGLLLMATRLGMDGGATRTVTSFADVHLRASRRRGTLLLYGVNPRTGLYAVSVDTSKGYFETKLTPIS